jgi:tRNA dimethylallyltransferase
MGPTASGKTGLGVELADSLKGEIISVDSALVYRGMDIGTAKPSAREMDGIPHHLIDIRDPAEPYSAADFRSDVIRLASSIIEKGKLPILVGGTMLYFKALKDGLAEMPEANQAIRAEIASRAEVEGWPSIHAELARVDPVAAARINPNDPQRLQRALEVFLVSGQSLTKWQQQAMPECPFDLVELAILPPDRGVLHQRIEQRFHNMLAQGFEAEVDALFHRGDLHKNLPSIKSVGYRQMWTHLEGETSRDVMVEKAIVATRQLAKRQYTWLRSWQNLRLLETPLRSGALKMLG